MEVPGGGTPHGSHKRQKCYDKPGSTVIQLAQDRCPSKVMLEKLSPLNSLSIPLKHNTGGFFLSLAPCWGYQLQGGVHGGAFTLPDAHSNTFRLVLYLLYTEDTET